MALLQTGDIIELNETHKIFGKVPELLVNPFRCTWKLINFEVSLDDHRFDYFIGKYVVEEIKIGSGKGRSIAGEKVICKNLQNGKIVYFYQTGSNVSNNIEAIKG